MANTRDFKETIQARAQREPAFRQGLLTESIQSLLAGDIAVGKSLLRDYVKATTGFEQLGGLTGLSPKSLMRMLSPAGNPTATKLFAIIQALQEREGVHLEVRAVR